MYDTYENSNAFRPFLREKENFKKVYLYLSKMPFSPQVIWNVATNTTVEATPPPSGPSLPPDWSFFSSAPSNPSLSLGRQDYESVWRYSSKAVYSVYNSDTDQLVRGSLLLGKN